MTAKGAKRPARPTGVSHVQASWMTAKGAKRFWLCGRPDEPRMGRRGPSATEVNHIQAS